MKKLFILIVFIAVFLHFYPQETLTAWYQNQKNTAQETFGSLTGTKIRIKTQKIYQDIEPKINQFKPLEKKFLIKITSNREALLSFHHEFCENKKNSAQLHAQNQLLVCNSIQKYRSRL